MPVATENKDVLAFAGHEHPYLNAGKTTDMDIDYETSKCNDNTISSKKIIHVEEEKSCDLVSEKKSSRAIIIFDWDDTLLSSSFLSSKGLRLDTPMRPCEELDTQLRQLENSVIAVLNLAMRFGEVRIVTNAETGWVELSARKFIPAVVPLLSKIKVISARSTYEPMHPDSPVMWKREAFTSVLSEFGLLDSEDMMMSELSPSEKFHVISFGDSHVEREAVRFVTHGLGHVWTKSVKFAERPTVDQLRRQLDLVTSCFEVVYKHEAELDLMLTISLVS